MVNANDLVFIGSVSLFTAIAAVWDWRTKRLPNRLTVPAFGLALAFHAVSGGWPGLGVALAGFTVGFGVLLVLWLIGGGGAGDVKMMGALGAWLGPERTVEVFLISVVLVVLSTSTVMLFRFVTRGATGFRRRYLSGSISYATPNRQRQAALRAKRKGLPYAVPVALGTWMLLTWNLIR